MNTETEAPGDRRVFFVFKSGITQEILVHSNDQMAQMRDKFISYLGGEPEAKTWYHNVIGPGSLFVIRWDEVESFYSLPTT